MSNLTENTAMLTIQEQLTLEVLQDTISLETALHQFNQHGIALTYSADEDQYIDSEEMLRLYQSTDLNGTTTILLESNTDYHIPTLTNHSQLRRIAKNYQRLIYAYNQIDTGMVTERKIKAVITDYLQNKLGIETSEYEWSEPARSIAYQSQWHHGYQYNMDHEITIEVALNDNNIYEISAWADGTHLGDSAIIDLSSVTEYLQHNHKPLSDCWEAAMDQICEQEYEEEQAEYEEEQAA